MGVNAEKKVSERFSGQKERGSFFSLVGHHYPSNKEDKGAEEYTVFMGRDFRLLLLLNDRWIIWEEATAGTYEPVREKGCVDGEYAKNISMCEQFFFFFY